MTTIDYYLEYLLSENWFFVRFCVTQLSNRNRTSLTFSKLVRNLSSCSWSHLLMSNKNAINAYPKFLFWQRYAILWVKGTNIQNFRQIVKELNFLIIFPWNQFMYSDRLLNLYIFLWNQPALLRYSCIFSWNRNWEQFANANPIFSWNQMQNGNVQCYIFREFISMIL